MDTLGKDFILLLIGAIISFIISWLFYKLPYQPIASYYHGETHEFFYEYRNGFNKKRYYKRKADSFYKFKIKKKDFRQIKKELVRRTIDN
jgi:hypothetical protein